jgi:hypothetical protein
MGDAFLACEIDQEENESVIAEAMHGRCIRSLIDKK